MPDFARKCPIGFGPQIAVWNVELEETSRRKGAGTDMSELYPNRL
jgi:hypothetical protein